MANPSNNQLFDSLLQDFNAFLRVDWEPSIEVARAASAFIVGVGVENVEKKTLRKSHLLALVNAKLKLNKENYQGFLDQAAAQGVVFNYHQKAKIAAAFDFNDPLRLTEAIQAAMSGRSLSTSFHPITAEQTLQSLHEQLRSGQVKRSDARNCDPAERRDELLNSLFGSFVYSSFPERLAHSYFNQDCRTVYHEDYYDHLKRFHPDALNRECTLLFLTIDERLAKQHPGEKLRDQICAFIRDAYTRLSNHCYLAILIKALPKDQEDLQWCLYSDIVLYAEKHRETRLNTGYFRPEEIAAETMAHIPTIDRAKAEFEIANEGFSFRDCIVIPQDFDRRSIEPNYSPQDLLLLFERNERDERLIPCPACRSRDVAGNSYPSLGIKSWECRNPICPDRSAFSRGNRYSLSSLIRQEAIKSDLDLIPDASLRRWKLDVVPGASHLEISEMLLRHFTLSGDRVVFVNAEQFPKAYLGRKIEKEKFLPQQQTQALFANFESSAFFKRFRLGESSTRVGAPRIYPTESTGLKIFVGKCEEVLRSVDTGTIHGAVTSPPYYNAKSYSTWPNIYTYLFDMLASAREVFRTIRPGGYYIFNIFDYFDNENILARSSMGKKRMILGPYIVNLFRHVGFKLEGNVVWYKGEIEGKRNFNQGNRSPYYQLPFNCWEHVFVFRKEGGTRSEAFPKLLNAKPVIKMVRGENTLGHPAPFPEEIPLLIAEKLPKGSTLLDPYAGSLTTARVALRNGLKTIAVDLHAEYCELGLKLIQNEATSLFPEIVK